MSQLILVINPGSTSTKIALFKNNEKVIAENLSHPVEEISKFHKVLEQKDFRKKIITEALEKKNYSVKQLTAVVGRGGLIQPCEGGTYNINDKMLSDLREGRTDHASNLGALIAYEMAKEANCPSFIVDPVVVDEFIPVARYTGTKLIERQSIFHALNQKAVARKTAEKIGKKYEDCNFVVCHMGGGISVGAHLKGKVIDNNNALDGEGPFSPERVGTLPAGQWLEICTSGKYTKDELKKILKGKGGFVSYLNTSDARDVEKLVIAGDKYGTEVHEAMCYQISKELGAYATALCGKVDRIILTGGMAYDPYLVKSIKEKTEWIAPIEIIPGEMEMEALWLGGKRVLEGTEKAKEYNPGK